MRLSRYISLSSRFSRRKAIEIIKRGRVRVNEIVVLDPAFKVDPQKDVIKLDNRELILKKRSYIILHKPVGYVSTTFDPHNKKTVFTLLKGHDELKIAGRLDKASEGLILLTDDGDLINRVTHPSGGCIKVYAVRLDAPLYAKDVSKILKGFRFQESFAKIEDLIPLGGSDYLFYLQMGIKRQIRRMCERVDKRVIRLIRIAMGRVYLDIKKAGRWRYLKENEIRLFFEIPEQKRLETLAKQFLSQ